MSWSIELLTEERLDEFVSIARELFDRSAMHHFGFDPAIVRHTGQRFIIDPSWLCQLAFIDGQCVGSLGGYIVPTLFSTAKVGIEEGLYVREGVLSRAAIAANMMRRFVKFCMDRGCVDVRVGTIAEVESYAIDVFYRRIGFRRIGSVYSLKNRSAV